MQYYIYGLYKKNVEYKKNSLSEHLFYIGITSDKNMYFRARNHRIESSNPHKLNVINKYDFILRIIWSVESKEEAEDRERFLIKWFGRVRDGGILTNILSGFDDTGHTRSFKAKTTNGKISKSLKRRNQDPEFRKLNRDRNLTVPYDQIMSLIEEWQKYPLETQQSFAKRKGISRSKFKDWIRLYKPECVGLTKRVQKIIFDSIEDKDKKRAKDIIKEFSDKSGLSFEKSKSIYYRLISRKY